ncbi:MAG: DUF47 family protein [Candidatus Omnitrophica bacterium]|nr:DUF47 family protein [Candidatus Omnitrophota bacterium]
MLGNFLPKEFKFFDLFEKQVDYAVNAASSFKDIVSRGAINEATLAKIQAIEHQGDEAMHDIIEQLNKTFITPFDREDIFALAKELDDVIDMINTIVSRLVVYKLGGVNKNLVDFSLMIEESIQALARAVKGLRNMKNAQLIKDACVEVNRLENVGDSKRDRVLAELFETEKNPIAVIKWKEVYQDAETVLDICEDVTHVVNSIMVKQA